MSYFIIHRKTKKWVRDFKTDKPSKFRDREQAIAVAKVIFPRSADRIEEVVFITDKLSMEGMAKYKHRSRSSLSSLDKISDCRKNDIGKVIDVIKMYVSQDKIGEVTQVEFIETTKDITYSKLEQEQGIYCLIEGVSTVVYIGVTIDIRKRTKGHLYNRRKEKIDFNHFLWVELPTLTMVEILSLEKTMIELFQPKFNTNHRLNDEERNTD